MAIQIMTSASKDPTKPRWIGKSTVGLAKPIAVDKVWLLLADFCNLHKILLDIKTSRYVEGPLDQPGMIRYCAGTKESSSSVVAATPSWANEKLIMINHTEKQLSYQILDNTFWFDYYVAMIGVTKADDEGGCRIKWSFESDPVEGWKEKDLKGMIDTFLNSMANKVKQLLLR